jgi:transposase
MTVPLEPLDVCREELERLVTRAEAGPLGEADLALLRAAIQTLAQVADLLATHGTTIADLRRLLLGQTPTSEKTRTVLAEAGLSPRPSSDSPANPPSPPARRRAPGHGRQAAAALTGARRVVIPHSALCPGDQCPACLRGKVYGSLSPTRLIRFRGQSPITATIYERQRLRCNLCGEIYTADTPPDAGPEKYDPTAASVLAVLKYGSGMPFTRLARLQRRLGIPVPATTQWDIVRDVAAQIHPAFDELQRQAAEGAVLYNDDTSVPILALRREPSPEGRTGCFTSGIVATTEGRQIALYRTGRPHAGENLATVLAQRPPTLPPPIQMCDALARNLPKLPEPLATIVGHCLAHARRRFVAVTAAFPEECRHVLETLGVVYRVDAEARAQGLTPEARLQRHQQESAPLMTTLRAWCVAQLDDRRVEPNSGLGQAIRYCLKHWERLTLFLRVAGAPLDTNIVERALKTAILHRKNALFYKTQRGAEVGDLYMSLIHTADLAGVNAVDYLTALQQHAADLARSPAAWMPWNYHEAQARSAPPATAAALPP